MDYFFFCKFFSPFSIKGERLNWERTVQNYPALPLALAPLSKGRKITVDCLA